MGMLLLYISILFHLPQRLLDKIDRQILIGRFQSVGRNLVFHYPGSHFGAERICIGDDVYIGEWAIFGGPIKIGSRVMFGPRPTIVAGNHIFAIQGKSPRFITPAFSGQNDAPVVIEDDVWIGANVTILGNVMIGIGAVIGAGSVVVKDIPPFTISVGNPCEPVRQIFSDSQIIDHLSALGYSESFTTNIVNRRKSALAEKELPVVDKTEEYPLVNYEILVMKK